MPIRSSRAIQNESDSDNEEELSRVATIREMQKLRLRPHGLTAEELALGKSNRSGHSKDELSIEDDSSNREGQAGGLVTKNNPGQEDLEAILLGRTFAHETNKRDEDKEMLKYIERELNKRRGQDDDDSSCPTKKNRLGQTEILNEIVPENLRPLVADRGSGGMLSQQMLCGIPEVDLGVETKMRNIIATEEAKQHLLRQRLQQHQVQESTQKMGSKAQPDAVSYVQHKRWRDAFQVKAAPVKEHVSPNLSSQKEGTETVNPNEEHSRDKVGVLNADRSTDLLHLKKFKELEQRKFKRRR